MTLGLHRASLYSLPLYSLCYFNCHFPEAKFFYKIILKKISYHAWWPCAFRASTDKYTMKLKHSNMQGSIMPRLGGRVHCTSFYTWHPAVQMQKFKIKNNLSADSLHNCYLVLLILWLNYNLLKPWRFAYWFICLNLHWHAFQSSE